jgi:opacity protein-like surface antigen
LVEITHFRELHMLGASTRWVVVTVAILVAVQNSYVAAEEQPWLDEFRIGDLVGENNTQFVHLEALFSPLLPGPTYVPAWLLSPRPMLGATISVQGKTDELFAGLTWSAPVPGPFLLEGSFGGTVHNQQLFVNYPDRPELTTRFMFRESIALGYQINPQWRVLVIADHDSNGDLGYLNHPLDHIGIELGRKFGAIADEAPLTLAQPPFGWNGFYFGPSGGLVLSRSSIAINYPPASGAFEGQQSKSLIIGGQIGYNWTIGNFIAGIEGDVSALSLHNGISNPGLVSPQFGPYIVNAGASWLATSRLRAGMNITQFPFTNGILVYGTGGAAFARISSTWCNAAGAGGDSYCLNNGLVAGGWSTQSEIKSGWTAWGGIEAPLAPYITGKIEYLYVDLAAAKFLQGSGTFAPKFSEQFVRAGLNFLFPVN